MKYLKYAAAVLLILAILTAVIHFYRESIAREFANSALGEYGITVTELSIQTLKTDYIQISHLVLEQDDGTRYQVDGLSFPISFPDTRAEKISIEKLIVTPADTAALPVPLADLLLTFLLLPGSVPDTEVRVSRLTLPDMPPIDNIVWRSTDQQQHLAFRIDPVDVAIDVDSLDDGDYQATVSVVVGGIPGALSLTLNIHHGNTGFSMDGLSRISLSPWLPVLKSIGMLPTDIVSLAAELDGRVTIMLHDDEKRSVPASANFLLASGMSADYRIADDSSVRLQTNSSASIRLDIEYPSLEWTASVGQIDMLVGINASDDIPLRLSDLECRSGLQCTMRVSLDTGPFELEAMTIGNARLSASLEITGDETTRVNISPDFVLALTGIEAQGFSVNSISTTQFSGAQLTIDDGGWRGDIDHMDLVFDSLTDGESLFVSLAVTLNAMRLRDSGAAFDIDVSIPPGSVALSWDGSDAVSPGVEGTISLRDNKAAASIVLFDDVRALSAHIDASHDLATGEGSLSVRDSLLLFDRRSLSDRFLKWPHAWDVVSGTLSTELELNWKTGDKDTEYSGTLTYHAKSLAGNYDDIAFAGLNTRLTASLDSTTGIAISPTSIEVALLDVGLPLERITADFAFNIREQSMQVQNLSMFVLGGQIVADPFRFDMRAETNDIVLRPQSIQLQFMVDLVEFERIKLTGSISGVLPVTISDETMTIANGRLESDPPGGVIRYLPGIDTEDAEVSDSELGLVSRALANFQFNSLTSDVEYKENGDLILQMRLVGINPDMDEKQPIILNLGVENNIPQLLRSLQAIRSIEEILERRSAH